MASALEIYNQCHVEVHVKCRYRDGSGGEKEVLKRVSPGQPELVDRIAAARILLSATAEDGAYVWEESTVELHPRKHTHAFSCACDPRTHDCPQVCLRPASRQMATSGAWVRSAAREAPRLTR